MAADADASDVARALAAQRWSPEGRLRTAVKVAAARADREARLAADEASLLAGNAPGHDEQLAHHQGQPTVETQMTTHGQAPPRVPDTGGHS